MGDYTETKHPETQTASEENAKISNSKRHLIFFAILVGLIVFAVVRSSVATRLDSFTLDEAYHIGAGVSYVQIGDFRLNPEHPPLIKLWAGMFVSNICRLSDFRAFQDKQDERDFVEEDIYYRNDFDLIQSRSRTAMFILNGLFLFLFALSARRVFGDIIALSSTAFFVIDPTVAAHLPVVMTDLPVALASGIAVLLGVQAFKTWRTVDLLLASLAFGLALSTKHSAVITMIAVGLIGIVSAFWSLRKEKFVVFLRRVGAVAAVLIGAIIILWSFYSFHFNESPNSSENHFNRPLAEKISDVRSPFYRAGLNLMTQGHLFPRAYTWGMADTIRAGAEGRVESVLAFGKVFYSKAPFYYLPGIIAVKVPLGLLLLTIIGAVFLVARRIPREFIFPFIGFFAFTVIFFIVYAKGSSYGGIRHILPAFPLLALLAGLAVYKAFEYKSYFLRGVVAVGLIAALASAIPVLRPWEYFNETVGGTSNGYLYFNDEGVDLSQRTKELARYYHEVLKPKGEIPVIIYFAPVEEMKKRGIDFVGNNPERDFAKSDTDEWSGTLILTATLVTQRLWWDSSKYLKEPPTERFGNLLIYRGTFPTQKAGSLFWRAIGSIYSDEPDTEKAINLLEESVALEPKAFFAALELGNQHLKTGNRQEALRAYRISKENAPTSDDIFGLLQKQIERLESDEPPGQIQPLRNPAIE